MNKATGRADLPDGRTWPIEYSRDIIVDGRQEAVVAAFEVALSAFEAKYNREPDWDEANFRGGFTTTEVLFEIMEGE